MTDADALTAAVAAAPDDDTPRLVFADYLEENGDPARAAFIRAQIELARTHLWEPFAVRTRAFQPDYVTGHPWRHHLPELDGFSLYWHPRYAMRRGFGWGLMVEFVPALVAVGGQLFAEHPVQWLSLPTATLDDWRALAKCPWLAKVRGLHFHSLETPIEPLRELAASEYSTGIEYVSLHRCDTPAIGEVFQRLFDSPMGARLKGLDFRQGDVPEELVSALVSGAFRPQRLGLQHARFDTFGQIMLDVEDIVSRSQIQRLDLSDATFAGLTDFGQPPEAPELRDLRIAGFRMPYLFQRDDRSSLGGWFANLRRLDLNRAVLVGGSLRKLSAGMPHLQSWHLKSAADSDELRDLLTSDVWLRLVELDLRENRLDDTAGRALLAAAMPHNLAALRLDGNLFSDGMAQRLRDKFAGRVIL